MDGATRYVQEQVIPQLRQMDRFKGFIGLGEYVHDCCTRLWPLPSSLHLCLAFCLQIDVFLEWACLDSNQGPLPYQGQLHVLCMFTVVQKYLQIPTYYFYGCSACLLLFRCVVVKLSSAPALHRPGQAQRWLGAR